VRALVRALVEETVAPLLRVTIELEHRIQKLEERPPPPAVFVSGAAQSPSAGHATGQGAQHLHTHAAAPTAYGRVVGPPPVLNVAAIMRDPGIQVDSALDGSKRKFRLLLTFIVLLVVAFGGLFAALAQSYAPPR